LFEDSKAKDWRANLLQIISP